MIPGGLKAPIPSHLHHIYASTIGKDDSEVVPVPSGKSQHRPWNWRSRATFARSDLRRLKSGT